jgi:bifunctional DNase/RNase
MKYKELKIIGLSYSQTQVGSYVIVLSEKNGNKKLPIIIKANEAQSIALKLEGIKTQKTLTHDLMKNVLDKMGGDLYEVRITHMLEGMIYTKLVFHNMIEEFEIESSIGDALCLAVTYKCPIVCSKEVLNLGGIEMDDDGNITEEQHEKNHQSKDISSIVSVGDLEKMLDKAIENEEYEIASQLRDKITELKLTEEKNKNV